MIDLPSPSPPPPPHQTHEAETVYSFGHMLYEMSSGRSLTTTLLDESCLTNIPQVTILGINVPQCYYK